MDSKSARRDHLLRSADIIDSLAHIEYDRAVLQAGNILNGSRMEVEQLRLQAQELCDHPSSIPISKNREICIICQEYMV